MDNIARNLQARPASPHPGTKHLVRDFEQRTDVAETLIRIAAIGTMIKRIA
mgnify:CR=1 FL=1